MSERVLVLSPHPDDEAIGCGGTIRRHVEEGDEVAVVFLTSGEGGGHGLSADETRVLREEEARRAAASLGYGDLRFWRLPDGNLSATAPLVERLRDEAARFGATRLYAPNPLEHHPDHRAAARLVRRAFRGRRSPHVLLYEVWTPVARIAEVVDVTPHVAAKLRAIRAYASQCRVLRFDHAARGLARYRGELYGWPKATPRDGRYVEVFQGAPR